MKYLAQKLTLPDLNGTPMPAIEGYLDPGTFGASGKLTLGDIISRALLFIFAFAGFGLLLMILSAGFSMLTSAGDAKQMQKAQQQLTFAIIGFIVIFVAFWIVQLLGTILGFQSFGIF